MAKAMGAHVITTCSTFNIDLCRSIGADEVLDYKVVGAILELKKMGPVFDLAIDNVNTPTFYNDCGAWLKPSGIFVRVVTSPSISELSKIMDRKLCSSMPGARSCGFHFVMESG